MLLGHERKYGLAGALVSVCSWDAKGSMVWASGQRVLLEHARNYGLGMDALVSICSCDTNGIMVWARMLFQRMLLGHERNYGLGLDALVSVCSWDMRGTMV